MINYFYQCELTDGGLFDESLKESNPDILTMSFVSRPFMTAEALQESIIDDFADRLKKKKDTIEVTSIKEVSPYKLLSAEILEKRLLEDEDYKEYVDTWQGPEGPEARFTFVEGNHHDPATGSFNLKMPPEEFLARYTVQSFEDQFVFPMSQYAHALSSSTLH